jgi:phosphoglycolate phosphatase
MKTYYKHIIFDLDGTLSDSREGIINSYQYACEKLGISNPGKEKLMSLIGPPLQKAFEDHFGLKGESIQEAVKVFREYYSSKGLYENTLYDNMKELVRDLAKAGSFLYVATSKYDVFARQVMKYFQIDTFFKDIAGADYEGNATKIDLITELLRRNGINDPDSVVMVGDTRYDILAAAELEIDSIGVTYGFSTEKQIEDLNPDYIAHQVSELRKFLLFE